MNVYLVSAAILAVAVGLAHSVIGEILVFSRMRRGTLVPTDGGSVLKERNVRILWASWHVLTVFGWALAAILWRLASPASIGPARDAVLYATTVAMAVGALLVFLGTKGRHPGWIGLLGVAVLTWLGVGH